MSTKVNQMDKSFKIQVEFTFSTNSRILHEFLEISIDER